MGRSEERLSAVKLAIESDVDDSYVSRLVEADLIEPSDTGFTWSDVWRVRTVWALESSGMSLERMAPHFASGRLSLAFLEGMLPPPAPMTGRTFADFAASLGERAELVGPLYEMLGLVCPDADVQMREDEERVILEMLDVWGDDPEVLKRAARLAGHAVRMIVEGWTGLHYELYRRLGGGSREQWPDGLQERETANAARALRLAERIPMWLTTRHYEEVLTSDIIENIEMVIDPFDERRADRPGVRQPAVVFIDLSGFTAMTEAEGDDAALSATARFEEACSIAARRHDGRVIKLLGDGALLHFPESLPAVRATLEIRKALAGTSLQPHAGIHCGPVAERDGDIFGRTVNMASRLATAATSGQVLVSASVAAATEGGGEPATAAGQRRLKGVPTPVPVFLVGVDGSDD